MPEAPKVFISYSHDSHEHEDRIVALSDDLRRKGIDCSIDQYDESPPEGWPLWCDRRVEQSQFVLVACTETYLRRFKGEEESGKGLGAVWEGHIVTQELYNALGKNTKFIPIVFSREDCGCIPTILQGATHYDVGDPEGREKLYRRLTGQQSIVKPPLGEIVEMPPRPAPEGLPSLPSLERKQSFLKPWNVPVSPEPLLHGTERGARSD